MTRAMSSFAAIDGRLSAAVDALHDYVWARARISEPRLLARLDRGARALDRSMGLRGMLVAGARPLLRRFRRETTGADLFMFLKAASDLSAAVRWSRSNPRQAAKRASELAVSLAIHLASASGRSDLVESFEAGTKDFGAFSSQLADVLEQRGALRAGEFRRAVNGAFDVRALWDQKASGDARVIAATASAVFAGYACVLFVDALKALGKYRRTPYARLVPVTRRLVARLGGHP